MLLTHVYNGDYTTRISTDKLNLLLILHISFVLTDMRLSGSHDEFTFIVTIDLHVAKIPIR